MKKLFFSALVAIVAVGSALSSQAITAYFPGGAQLDCNTGSTLCSSISGNLYTSATVQDETTIISNKATYFGSTRYNP